MLRPKLLTLLFLFISPSIIWSYNNSQDVFPYEISFFYDENNLIERDQVLEHDFQNLHKLPFNNGLNNGYYWFKIIVDSQVAINSETIFEIREPYINSAVIYKKEYNGLTTIYELGNSIALNDKPISNRNIAFPITISLGKNEYYIHASFHRNASLLFFIQEPNTYFLNEIKAWSVFSFYYGCVLIIILLNLFYLIKFKDYLFLYYSITLALISLGFMCLDGIMIYVVPSGWLLTNVDVLSYMLLTYFGGYLFASRYLSTEDCVKYSKKFELAFVIITNLLFVICLFTDSAKFFALGLVSLILFSFYYWVVSILQIKQNKYAIFFTAAYSILIISIVLYAIPVIFGHDLLLTGSSILKVGGIIEIIVLSYAIVYRMSILKEENAKMTKSIHNYIKELNETKSKLSNKLNHLGIEDSRYQKIKSVFELTERELDVLRYIMSDKTNSQIAETLFVSVNTIKYHIRNIYRKLNTNDREQVLEEIQKVLN